MAGIIFVAAGTVRTGRLHRFGIIGLLTGLICCKCDSMHKTLCREEQVQGKNQYGKNMSAGDSHDWHRGVVDNLCILILIVNIFGSTVSENA